MRVAMIPHITRINGTSGIDSVVRNYFRYLPEYGIDLVNTDEADFDLMAVHAGMTDRVRNDLPLVSHIHGLYWTEDYQSPIWEHKANRNVVNSIRHANEITVPSEWVAETFRRDMRYNPHIVPHGVNADEWKHDIEPQGYVLAYAKNRIGDVCDPWFMRDLANKHLDLKFIATFAPDDVGDNVETVGLLDHDKMKKVIQGADVVMSPVKETFGVLTLEAMAAGRPVLGFAEGGNLDLIQHGVTGYLAEPGNLEDLYQGLSYCLKHAPTLGANAQEIVRKYTWERACEMVANIYRKAYRVETPSVAVIITVYNKPRHMVTRAIDSVLSQTLPADQIIVVNDGSDQESYDWITRKYENQPVLFLDKSENQGVAVARNLGIEHANTKYVACLDADDAMKEEFLEVCVNALESDSELSIAYTGITYIDPNGNRGISKWPGIWDYNRQIKPRNPGNMRGMNQIPCLCVYTKDMWKRLGGYRKRYAPRGAGEEDAELWTRAGAYGFKAKKVSEEGLFIYSSGGAVSGSTEHRETDWLAMHPWVLDGRHPFPSYAAPENGFAHPVRQYDEPRVSVIIPVGAGHHMDLINALDSLEAQAIRRWEAVIVNDSGREIDQHIQDTYPYIRIIDTAGGMGAGYARNRGAEAARAPFLLFLDADDWLHPNALKRMIETWEEFGEIVFTDYVGKVIPRDEEMEQKLLKEIEDDHSRHVIGKNGRELVIHHAHEFRCDRAMRQPPFDDREMPYAWALVTCLIPKKWHNEIGGFDESMDSWEDVDYHWRMVKAGKCYSRVPEDLVIYRFYTGQRRAVGLQNAQKLLKYLKRKHKQLAQENNVGCGCGQNTATPTAKVVSSASKNGNVIRENMAEFQTVRGEKLRVSDQDLVEITYMSKNRGMHRVIGPVTKIFYGRRKGGDRFLVHEQDVYSENRGRVTVSHVFQPVRTKKPPKQEKVAPPAPQRIAATQSASPEPAPPSPPPITREGSKPFDLQLLPGVGPSTAKQFKELGLDSAEAIASEGASSLSEMISGISFEKAQIIIDAAEDYLG